MIVSAELGSSNSPSLPNTPGNLRETLRFRQLARTRRSCLPCRERKVRCNREHPCLTCRKRDHADLCSYEDDTNADGIASRKHRSPASHAPVSWNGPRATGIGNRNTTVSLFEEVMVASDSNHASSDRPASIAAAESTLLEGSSVLNIGRQTQQHPMQYEERQAAFETGVLPLLGAATEASSATPNDAPSNFHLTASNQDMIRLFEAYRTRVHPFHHITFDLDRVEEKLCQLIHVRSTSAGARSGLASQDLQWLCLLHAILASGAQFSDLPTEQRIFLSKTHSEFCGSSLGSKLPG